MCVRFKERERERERQSECLKEGAIRKQIIVVDEI